MTKKTPKPTPAHMQKLADLMDTRPEGVSLRQAQNTLSVSPTLAKAALIEIGATEVDGKWVFEPEKDDATLEEIGNFVSQPKVDKPTQAEIDACSDTCAANICGALNVCFMDKAPVEPEPATKSNFALALEAERQRVFDAVAIGGTAERLAELTGLHVDDVQQHLDALIVDGAIYQKPIIVAMSYGVIYDCLA
ncbi:MAG: hypothetical protein WA154_08340 [Moraxellaceae bacterium]